MVPATFYRGCSHIAGLVFCAVIVVVIASSRPGPSRRFAVASQYSLSPEIDSDQTNVVIKLVPTR